VRAALFRPLSGMCAGAVLLLAAAAAPRPPADLIVSRIAFAEVRPETDASGRLFWSFDVVVTVRNQGRGDAAASRLLLERNSGPGGVFQPACPDCTAGVPALAAGAEAVLPPRRIDNSGGAPVKFRATADVSGSVAESDKTNNSSTMEFSAPDAPPVRKAPGPGRSGTARPVSRPAF